MNTDRSLFLGVGGFLLIFLLVGLSNFTQTTQFRHDLGLILGQDIEEAVEQIKNGASFMLHGSEQEGSDLIAKNELRFEKAMHLELSTITGSWEGEKMLQLQELYTQYRATLDFLRDSSTGLDAKRQIYQDQFLPLHEQIKNTTGEILRMSQENRALPHARSQNEAGSERQQTFYRFPPYAWPLQKTD